jgi:uncharacterized lipoprotein YajG
MKIIFLRIFTILALAFIFILTGCAKDHRVLINPSIPIHNSTIGKGLTVAVKVVDTRSSNIISKWQGEFKVRKFTVTSQGDLKDIFTTRVRQGLSMLGFSPKNLNLKPGRSLIIEILNIKSHYQQNPPKINIQVKADIKATCRNKGKKVSKKFSSRKNRSGISPASFPNENLLNDNLSEIMGRIFTDPSVISCLNH